jgi:hypothetical protein
MQVRIADGSDQREVEVAERTLVRRKVSLDAVISCPRFGLLRGTITDLSEDGLYIRADTIIVPIHAEVSITFTPVCALCNDAITVRGRVRHQSLHGFGIMFDRLDPACRSVLAAYLPAMPRTPAHAYPVLRAV